MLGPRTPGFLQALSSLSLSSFEPVVGLWIVDPTGSGALCSEVLSSVCTPLSRNRLSYGLAGIGRGPMPFCNVHRHWGSTELLVEKTQFYHRLAFTSALLNLPFVHFTDEAIIKTYVYEGPRSGEHKTFSLSC